MTTAPVHYVPLNCIVEQPPRVLAVCGKWCHGANWSTAPGIVSCSECLAYVAVSARLGGRAIGPPESSLTDAARPT